MSIVFKLVVIFSGFSAVFSQIPGINLFGPVKTIVDTDIGPWSDDVGTLAMLYHYMDMKMIKILGIVSSNPYEGAAGVIDLMNTYYHYPDIMIGVTKDENAVVNKGRTGWVEYVLEHFPHPKYNTNDEAEDAVRVYRKILSTASDRSIIITSIGYFTNLMNLMNSSPDDISPLSGQTLIRRKVRNLIAMAGNFPNGQETNVMGKPQEVIDFFRKWTLPITFVGSEIGHELRCGGNLINPQTNQTFYPKNPVGIMYELAYDTYGLDGCYDHSAAILLAKGNTNMFRSRYGTISVNETGHVSWRLSFLNIWTLRNHVEMLKKDEVLDEINTMMIKGSGKNN